MRWAHRVQSALRRRAQPADPAPVAVAAVPVTAEWDEAFLRVESYLSAHRIESRVRLNQLASEIISDARTLALEHPEEPPVTVAMQIAHARIGKWLVGALGAGDWADERCRARGRLAVLMSDIPRTCPEHFLTPSPLPSDLGSRLAAAELQSGPDVRLTGMPSAPLEFPLTEFVDGKWETFSRTVFLRSATTWVVLCALLGVAWFATR